MCYNGVVSWCIEYDEMWDFWWIAFWLHLLIPTTHANYTSAFVMSFCYPILLFLKNQNLS
jgi:hypothetical protein